MTCSAGVGVPTAAGEPLQPTHAFSITTRDDALNQDPAAVEAV